jgi:hypothetical protein
MKKLALLFLLLLASCREATAGVPCSLPFNLQNGQPADATQVMANYNALVACLGNAAAAGINTDIQALTGLTTPLIPSLGGTQTFVATAPSGGSNNAQTIAATTPTGFAATSGFTVVFVAGFTNSDATTLTVGASAPISILRRTSDGLLPFAGGELIANTMSVATYDGTQFQLISSTQVPIGTVLTTLFTVPDNGFILMAGQCVNSIGSLNSLWKKMGQPGQQFCPNPGFFPLPDGRGRYIAMIDSGGTGRITPPNWDGSILGNSGGQQILPQSALPNTPLFYGGIGGSPAPSQNVTGTVSGGNLVGGAGSSLSGVSANIIEVAPTWTNTGAQAGQTSSLNGNTGQTGSLPPTLMLNRQIKY